MPKKKQKHEIRNKPDKAWFKTRMYEIGKSVEEAATLFKTYPNMVWRMTSGQRKIRPDEMAVWSRFLEVPYNEIARRFGVDVPIFKVPVVGIVRPNGRVSQILPNERQFVEAPTDASAHMLALVVDAPMSSLMIWDGSYLYYEPTEVLRTDAFGRLSVVEIRDWPPVVGVLDRASMGQGRVTLLGSQEKIDSKHVERATPIKWQRAG